MAKIWTVQWAPQVERTYLQFQAEVEQEVLAYPWLIATSKLVSYRSCRILFEKSIVSDPSNCTSPANRVFDGFVLLSSEIIGWRIISHIVGDTVWLDYMHRVSDFSKVTVDDTIDQMIADGTP